MATTETIIKDLYGYLQVTTKKGESAEVILATLAHDIGGIVRQEPCFLPRTHGYAKFIE